jgi:UDP-glucuronate decarboxylase
MAVNDGRVVSNFIVQALENKDLTVYGDGSQTRSFCYVDDLIAGLISLFFSGDLYEPINFGNPEPIDMSELAKEIIKMTGSKSQIIFQSIPADDPRRREPDIKKAKDLLGWEPKISRSIGLGRTIDFFRKELAN